jgi:tetratricopeptide (TPR) repeat protein
MAHDLTSTFPSSIALRLARACGLAAFLAATGIAGELIDRANELYASGDYLKAAAVFRKAAREGESPALCYFNMGNAYFQLDSLPQALVYYRACIGSAPGFFKAQMNLAVVCFTLGDMGACIAAVKRALEIEPNDAKCMLILAAACRSAGALAEAAVVFEGAVSRHPEMEEPYVALGEIYRDLDDAQAAIDWLLRYPAGGANQSYVWMSLADLYERLQDPTKALYYLQQAFSIDRTRPWLLFRMVELHDRTGNDLVALETAREGMALFPKNAEIPVVAGNIAFRLQRFAESELFYSRAAALGSPAAVVGLENIRQMRKAASESKR